LSRVSAAFEPYPEVDAVWTYLVDRYGLGPAVFAEHCLWHRPGAASIWIAHQDLAPPEDLRIETVGLVAFRQPLPRGYPSSAFLRRFGAEATRGCYDVDWPDALRLMHGQAIPRAPLDERAGPYVVRSPRAVLGRGWLREGQLRLDAPKMWRQQLMTLAESLPAAAAQ